MLFVWTVGETGKKTDETANVELAHCAGKDKFAKNIYMRATFLGDNLLCFRHLLRWTFESHQMVSHSWLNGNRHRTFMFIECRGIPSMCMEHAIDVGIAAQLDTNPSLKDVNAIALLVETSISFNAHGSTFSLNMLTDLVMKSSAVSGNSAPTAKSST